MECADRTGARTSRLGNERGSIFRPLPLASQKSGPEAGSVSAAAQGQERGIGRARRRVDSPDPSHPGGRGMAWLRLAMKTTGKTAPVSLGLSAILWKRQLARNGGRASNKGPTTKLDRPTFTPPWRW